MKYYDPIMTVQLTWNFISKDFLYRIVLTRPMSIHTSNILQNHVKSVTTAENRRVYKLVVSKSHFLTSHILIK